MKLYLCSRDRNSRTLLLINVGWLLVLGMLLFHKSESRMLKFLVAACISMITISNISIFFLGARLLQVTQFIFERFPNLVVHIFAVFIFSSLALLYTIAYFVRDVPVLLGLLATFLFSVALIVNLPFQAKAFVLPRLILIGIGVFLAVVPLEIFLGNYGGGYQVWSGNINKVFIPADGVMPGIEGESHFSTDQFGIRGDPYDSVNPNVYRILTIGGSTTEALYLDNTEAWPYLIQQLAIVDGKSIWVGNVGRSGHKTLDHFIVIRHFVPKFDFDLVIIMAGINDMLPSLRLPEDNISKIRIPNNLSEANTAISNFDQIPYRVARWRGGPLIFADFLLHTLDKTFIRREEFSNAIDIEDEAGKSYITRREKWYNAPSIINELPENFNEGLEVYRANLIDLIAEAQKQEIMIVLITQPSSWSSTMPEDFKRYLWIAYKGDSNLPSGRYSVEILAEGMAQYNQVMLEVCEEHTIPCVDLAAEMNGDLDFFYDDVHFNEKGARVVAEVIWSQLADLIFRE